MSDLLKFNLTVINQSEDAAGTVQAFLSAISSQDKFILQTTLNGKFFFMVSSKFDTDKFLKHNTGFVVHETYMYNNDWVIGWGFYDLNTLESVKMWVYNGITTEEKERFAENLEILFMHFMLQQYGLLDKPYCCSLRQIFGVYILVKLKLS